MEEKIKEKLDEYGFLLEDLTENELEELKNEIDMESKGYVILDGVLSQKPLYGHDD